MSFDLPPEDEVPRKRTPEELASLLSETQNISGDNIYELMLKAKTSLEHSSPEQTQKLLESIKLAANDIIDRQNGYLVNLRNKIDLCFDILHRAMLENVVPGNPYNEICQKSLDFVFEKQIQLSSFHQTFTDLNSKFLEIDVSVSGSEELSKMAEKLIEILAKEKAAMDEYIDAVDKLSVNVKARALFKVMEKRSANSDDRGVKVDNVEAASVKTPTPDIKNAGDRNTKDVLSNESIVRPSLSESYDPRLNEVIERSKNASEKIKNQVFKLTQRRSFFENSLRKHLDYIRRDFSWLIKNPEDQIGGGEYKGWTSEEIKEYYFVLYGTDDFPKQSEVQPLMGQILGSREKHNENIENRQPDSGVDISTETLFVDLEKVQNVEGAFNIFQKAHFLLEKEGGFFSKKRKELRALKKAALAKMRQVSGLSLEDISRIESGSDLGTSQYRRYFYLAKKLGIPHKWF